MSCQFTQWQCLLSSLPAGAKVKLVADPDILVATAPLRSELSSRCLADSASVCAKVCLELRLQFSNPLVWIDCCMCTSRWHGEVAYCWVALHCKSLLWMVCMQYVFTQYVFYAYVSACIFAIDLLILHIHNCIRANLHQSGPVPKCTK